MSTVWNLINPLRTGSMKLQRSGREKFGTVIKHGKITRTVTVKVDYQFWDQMYRRFFSRSSKFLVHDEDEYCVTGDKVVIRNMLPISKRKHYYVRNIVKAAPREDYYEEKKEKNEVFEKEYKRLFDNLWDAQKDRVTIRNKKEEVEAKEDVKRKALLKAQQFIKKLEAEKLKKKAETK